MIRAKFKVDSVSCVSYAGGNQQSVITLSPVYSGSEENKQFYQETPGGKIELSVVRSQVAAQFVAGKEYYIDFTPAS